MATEVFCPHCSTTRMASEDQLGLEVTCRECGNRFVLGGKPLRRARRSEDEDDDDERPRRRPPPPENLVRERLGAPATFLLVVAVLQAGIRILMFGMIGAMELEQPQGLEVSTLLVVGFLALLGFCKDFFVIRGTLAMRQGRNYGRATLGAWVGMLPDAGCLFALIAAIWCVSVLNDPRVRRAFRDRPGADEYEDDYDDF